MFAAFDLALEHATAHRGNDSCFGETAAHSLPGNSDTYSFITPTEAE